MSVIDGGQLTMNLTDTEDSKSSFQNHYSVSGNSSALQNELEFPWTDFRDWALDGMSPAQTILGLIHRYDPTSGNWYLTCGQYSFSGYTGPQSYSIAGPSGLFDLNADGRISNYSGGLQSSGTNYYDPQYFNNVLYDSSPLNLNTNVRSARFAWEELKQLHYDNRNHIPGANDALFTIRFCSIAPDCTSQSGMSSVPFPHSIAAYMMYNGTRLLNDNPIVTGAVFIDKAADFSSLCPPSCNSYEWPIGLTPKNC